MIKETPIILKRHTDSSGNFTAKRILNEKKQIIKRQVLLEQIPHPHLGLKVHIENSDINLVEIPINEQITSENYFKIDYTTGKIWFYEGLEALEVIVDYWGIGYDLIHANRIYTQVSSTGDVVETLGDILDYAIVIIKELGEIKVAVEEGKLLNQDLLDAIERSDSLYYLLNETITTASNLKNKLDESIAKGNLTYEDMDRYLELANDKITELKSLSASVGEMLDISNNTSLIEVKVSIEESIEEVAIDLQDQITTLRNVLNKIESESKGESFYDTKYLRLDGTNRMEAGIMLPINKRKTNKEYGVDFNTSDLVNVNGVYFNGLNHPSEGIHFSKNGELNIDDLHMGNHSNYFDTFRIVDGKAYVNNFEIWSSGNQGANSGLDADTLDGIHANNFIQIYNGVVSNSGFIRFDNDGILPNLAGTSTLGASNSQFSNIYTKKIEGCSEIVLSKSNGYNKINISNGEKVYIEHRNGKMNISMGAYDDSSNSLSIGIDQDGHKPLFEVSGEGITKCKGLMVQDRRIFVQTTQPSSPKEGDIWFE